MHTETKYIAPFIRRMEVLIQEGYAKSSAYSNDPYNDGDEHEW